MARVRLRTAQETQDRTATAQPARKRRAPPGTAPGTLIPDPHAPPPTIRVIAYNANDILEVECDDPEALPEILAAWPVVWVDVVGLGNVGTIRRLGELLDLHHLSLEDVVNVHQRPKVEDYEDHLFIVMRMVDAEIATEQLSMFLGSGFVLTFQERPGDSFEPVRERLRRGRAIRERGADYLAYALTDAVVDAYFPVLEAYGESLEILREKILHDPTPPSIAEVDDTKRELLTLRRAAWPQRDMVGALMREEADGFFQDKTRPYLRDTYDHCMQIVELTESFRDLASSLSELYATLAAARSNEVMRVLTMVATIFIPLSFIAGVYGMNFDPEVSPYNMPELRWALGYPFVLFLMASVAFGLLGYFYRKGWLRRFDRPPRSKRD